MLQATWGTLFPSITIEIAARATAIEFCACARVWRYESEPIITEPGEASYDFDLPRAFG